MNTKDLAALLLLAAIWGASFLFMRIAAPEIGSLFTAFLRVSIAALGLLLFALLSGNKLDFLHNWKKYFVVGALNAALPFALICTAQIHLSASLAAILNATTPLFTAIAAWLWTKESLGCFKILGLILGVFGVAVLVGWSPEPMGREIYFSASLSLLAAVSYALAGIYSSRAFKGFKPFNVAVGQQISASILLFPFALYTLPHELPPMNVVFSVLCLALLCTSFAYLLFFRLINNVGPIKTLTVTFLVPIFAVLWGTIFLGEHVYPNTIAGLVLIIVSIILVTNLLTDYMQRKKYDILKRNLSND